MIIAAYANIVKFLILNTSACARALANVRLSSIIVLFSIISIIFLLYSCVKKKNDIFINKLIRFIRVI